MSLQGMQTDYREEALHCVSMKPENGKPMLLKSSYPFAVWHMMVMGAKLQPNSAKVRFIMDDTEEGQGIVQGTDLSDLTPEYLVALDEGELRLLAKRFKVEIKGTKFNPKVTALKIMTAIAEGAKPAPLE